MGLLLRFQMLSMLFGLCLLAQTALASTTHLIAIGVCPPWKGMDARFCTDTVADMSQALSQRFDIPAQNTHTLLNEQATVAGLADFLNGLPAFTKSDRLVLYTVMHNGSNHAGTAATAANDVMVFWSEKDPRVTQFALAEHKWLKAGEFATWLHQLGMGELIAVFDACQSGAIALDVMHDVAAPGTQVATISSAKPGQLANLTQDLSRPLFSGALIAALATGAKSPLPALLASVDSDVSARAIPICAQRKEQMRKNNGFEPNCNQTPIFRDPDGLLAPPSR